MQVYLQKSTLKTGQTLLISGSKSESNRLLMLQQLFPQIQVNNLSVSDDVEAMQRGLAQAKGVVDVHHAGTTMRFLTAYFALCQDQKITLKGSERMHNRPISVLVDALRALGANITYLEKEGYPPLFIEGNLLAGGKVCIPASISSQYISALLLVGAYLKKGIQLELEGEITSRPYIEMTLALLEEVGTTTTFEGQRIVVQPLQQLKKKVFTVEADWSSASYYYSFVALSPVGTCIRLGKYKKNSLQGDAALVKIYAELGVETTFEAEDYVQLTKVNTPKKDFEADFRDTPDLAQTVVVTCFGLGISCHIQGLHTLKIKETDRLLALQSECDKLGGQLVITADALRLGAARIARQGPVRIATYDDHRMAMAFAPLALQRALIIEDADVVTKSYPSFWKDLEKLGIVIRKSH